MWTEWESYHSSSNNRLLSRRFIAGPQREILATIQVARLARAVDPRSATLACRCNFPVAALRSCCRLKYRTLRENTGVQSAGRRQGIYGCYSENLLLPLPYPLYHIHHLSAHLGFSTALALPSHELLWLDNAISAKYPVCTPPLYIP